LRVIDVLRMAVSDLVRVFCVDDELFEGEKHLHLFFVQLRVKDVLKQDQLIQAHSEVVSSNHDSDLSLDLASCLFIDWVSEIKVIIRLVVT